METRRRSLSMVRNIQTRRTSCAKSVSYTHLDVYKRQMLYILRVGVLNMKTEKR